MKLSSLTSLGTSGLKFIPAFRKSATTRGEITGVRSSSTPAPNPETSTEPTNPILLAMRAVYFATSSDERTTSLDALRNTLRNQVAKDGNPVDRRHAMELLGREICQCDMDAKRNIRMARSIAEQLRPPELGLLLQSLRVSRSESTLTMQTMLQKVIVERIQHSHGKLSGLLKATTSTEDGESNTRQKIRAVAELSELFDIAHYCEAQHLAPIDVAAIKNHWKNVSIKNSALGFISDLTDCTDEELLRLRDVTSRMKTYTSNPSIGEAISARLKAAKEIHDKSIRNCILQATLNTIAEPENSYEDIHEYIGHLEFSVLAARRITSYFTAPYGCETARQIDAIKKSMVLEQYEAVGPSVVEWATRFMQLPELREIIATSMRKDIDINLLEEHEFFAHCAESFVKAHPESSLKHSSPQPI